MMKIHYCLLIFIVISACSTVSKMGTKHCDTAIIDVNGFPCWVNQTPQQGVVMSMSQHIDPSKTREILFKKALLEIAAGKGGLSITEDSIVKKRVEVHGSRHVSQKAEVISLASVKTARGDITVKAKVKDEWTHPNSKKMYLWVISVD